MWRFLIGLVLFVGVNGHDYFFSGEEFVDSGEEYAVSGDELLFNGTQYNVTGEEHAVLLNGTHNVTGEQFFIENESCTVGTPYPVYEFKKLLPALLESIPQTKCDQSPIDQIVRFNCKTYGDDKFYEIDFRNRSAVKQMKKGKWGFVVHGFLGDCFSDWPLELLRVWTASENINVCCVDWHQYAKCNYYVDATKYVYRVASYLARVIRLLSLKFRIPLKDIIPVGHSFGAIIVGQAAQFFKNPQLPLCVGLDPAGWAYTKPLLIPANRRLDASQCGTVKTVITDIRGLGSKTPMGSVNIYANGGRNQPMCRMSHFPCNHFAATTFFIESIRPNQTMNYGIETIDGSIKDYWTLYARDVPGNYTLKTGPCYPYSLAQQPKKNVTQIGGGGNYGQIVCEDCINIINSTIIV